ncbi:putative toxin VapC [Candidatus Termititenax dinenymphae]|uniref:Toxin VapC n=1 Tax=Candidatus Termititenax dinenymphae TaxID=2218523 RepID=A0A388TLW7_9BACT|nr:putative toxin VapC [Candidatus Termititenax dinenymphae]
MTVFALDSNIVSYFLRNDKKIKERIVQEINDGNEIVIPPIVYFEVKRGLLAINAPQKSAAFEMLCDNLEIGIIEKNMLDIAAQQYAELRKKGKTADDADLLIAAYCICNNFTLVTNNIKHFDCITGLDVVNWM